MIQTLIHINTPMTFEQVAASLFTEAHRREHRKVQLGEEVLATTFGRGRGATHFNRGGRG
jgi:hypothetical protein